MLIDDVLQDMATTGGQAPKARSEPSYSGKFLVRLTPEAHRRIALDAVEEHGSLDRLAPHRLVGTP